MDDVPEAKALKAMTLTHVPGMGLSLSLIPVFISLGGFVSRFIFLRELQGVFFAFGLLPNYAALEVCDSHGWPSSHSQYMFCFASYFTLLCLLNVAGVSSPRSRHLLALLPWPAAFLTLYSLVYLGYHTVAQVIAGATLRMLLGAGWFWVVNTTPGELKFEYDNVRAARKKLAID